MPPEVREPVMEEMSRVVAPEGQLLMIDYYPGRFSIPKGWFYRAVILAIEFGAGWEHFQNHRNFLARQGLPRLMQKQELSPAKEKILAGGNIHVVLAKPSVSSR
jgi:ubiquinone/menaquinone biosynthesis C-methylase UbiE